MEDNRVLKLVYTFFLGILLALFVGLGINTFYPGPKAPQYPIEFNTYGKEPTAEQTKKQQEFEVLMQQHNEKMKPYNRNVSIMTLISAVILLAFSMQYGKKIKFIADGVMLGGLITLLYSIGRGFASEDSKYVFMIVTMSLAVVVYLGYHRFVLEHATTKPAEKTK